MAMCDARPEKLPRIGAEASPPCIECGNCRVGKVTNGVRNGICTCPDNMVDEFIENIEDASGWCGGFVKRSVRMVA